MSTKEAELLELMRADRLMLNERQAEQTAIDLEAASEDQSRRRGTLKAGKSWYNSVPSR